MILNVNIVILRNFSPFFYDFFSSQIFGIPKNQHEIKFLKSFAGESRKSED